MPNQRHKLPKYGRRAMLEQSAAGIAGLAAGLIGGLTVPVEAGQGAAARSAAPAARTRRYVTAHNAAGKSFIQDKEIVDVASLWSTTPEMLLGASPSSEPKQVSRLTGQTRCFVAAIVPSRDPKPNLTNRIGFHKTPGIAYCYVLNGEVVFLVDEEEVTVKAGEIVVERNTMHSWRNETNEPVRMIITVVNATA
jgi:mannose-6-phosphate isomerase-like protein (cupin superfamily)